MMRIAVQVAVRIAVQTVDFALPVEMFVFVDILSISRNFMAVLFLSSICHLESAQFLPCPKPLPTLPIAEASRMSKFEGGDRWIFESINVSFGQH